MLTGSGYVVTGDRYISLGVRVPGRIEAYLVEEGERVEKGQPLVRARLRDRSRPRSPRRAQGLAEARAQVALSSKELKRQGRAARSRTSRRRPRYEVKETQLDVARATVDRLAARVG